MCIVIQHQPAVITVEEGAAYLRIPRSSVYKIAQKSRIPCQKVSRHWRFHREAIDQWLGNVSNPGIEAMAYCLQEGLHRLCKKGHWRLKEWSKSISLVHSSCPTRQVCVELLPSLSVSIQSRKKGKPISEKVFIPFAINVSQIFNLIDITARNLYHSHFDNPTKYLANKRKLRTTITQNKKKYNPIFRFASKNRYVLMALMAWLEETQ